MPRLTTLVPILCLCCLAAAPLDAATRKLQLRSVLHDPLKPQADLFVPVEDGGRDFLFLALQGMSETQQVLLTDGMLRLFDTEEIDPEKPLAGMVAATRIPDAVQRAILLIFPSGKGDSKLPYHLIVINDDGRSFPKGESRVLNMTARPMAMKAGEHNVKLPPAKISPVPAVKQVNHMNQAPTSFYRQGDEEIPWILVAERPMQFVPDSRHLIIVYQLPGTKAPRLRTITDAGAP